MKTFNKNIWLLVLLMYVGVMALPPTQLSVINAIGLLSGERGTALTLSAEGPIDATITGKGTVVKVTIRKCVYGIDELRYNKFPLTSPVKSIESVDKKGGVVEINVVMKNEVHEPFKTVYKKDQYMALLSEKPEQHYVWNTDNNSPHTQSGENAEAVTADRDSAPAELTNIRLLERGQISELVFEFDKKVKGTIRRKNEIIDLTIENTINKIGKNEIKISAQNTFDKINMYENVNSGQKSLRIVFKIDSKTTDTSLNVAFTQGEVVSVYLMKREHQKATLWTSGHGLEVDHKFYNVPSYNVDMQTIGLRAESDVKKKILRNNVFTIKEQIVEKQQENTIDSSTAGIRAQETTSIEIPDNNVHATKSMSKLIVATAGVVNLRATPSIKGTIAAKLHQGDTLTLISEKSAWCMVALKGDTGYIYKSLVQKIPGTLPIDVGNINNSETLLAAQTDVPPTIQKVSNTPVETIPPEEVEKSMNSQVVDLNAIKKELPELRKKIVQYHGGGRDPFMPIGSDSIGISEYPFVENLTLVGILIDDYDKIALCEDTKNGNRPFTLREQDEVFKGKVLKIYKDKIVFLLTEYGISRSLTLSLASKKNTLEASKK